MPVVGGTGAASVAEASQLKHLRLRRFDDDIMVEGYLKDSALYAGISAKLGSKDNSQ